MTLPFVIGGHLCSFNPNGSGGSNCADRVVWDVRRGRWGADVFASYWLSELAMNSKGADPRKEVRADLNLCHKEQAAERSLPEEETTRPD